MAEIDNVWESIEVARRMARGHMELSKQLVSAPTASPKASEGAEPSAELDALQTIRDAVLHLDANEGFSNDQVNHILDIIDDNWPDTRVAPAPDPGEYPGVAARFKQDFGVDHPRQMRKSEMAAPDPRVEEIRKRWGCLAQWANSDFPGLQDIHYLLSKLDGKEQR